MGVLELPGRGQAPCRGLVRRPGSLGSGTRDPDESGMPIGIAHFRTDAARHRQGGRRTSLSTYLEIIFGSKLRLLALVIVLPVAFAGADLYLWRSYTASEVIWVPDTSTYAQNLTYNLGFDPYSTPGQNFARLFSNLLGAANFNTALLTQLSNEGAILTARDRNIVTGSLNLILVAPGRASGSSAGSGAAGGAAANGDHVVTVKYTCSKKDFCVEVLQAVLNVFVTTYVDLKTKAAN